MATRAVLAVVAVLAIGWLGVLLRNEHVLSGVGNHVFSTASGDQKVADRDLDRLEGAALLTPDPKADLQRAAILLLLDRRAEAAAIATERVRHEPANLDAWMLLYRATEGIDRRREVASLRNIRRLNPLSARARGPAVAQP